MDDLMLSKDISYNWFDLVSPGVFAILDETSKQVFISCSNNIVKGISSVVTRIKEKDHVCSNMVNPEIVILHLGSEPRFEGSKFINQYQQKGYNVLNKVPPIVVTVKIRVLPLDKDDVVVVTLRNSRGEERLLAAFETMSEALIWKDNHYYAEKVSIIVSEDSELLRKVKSVYE